MFGCESDESRVTSDVKHATSCGSHHAASRSSSASPPYRAALELPGESAVFGACLCLSAIGRCQILIATVWSSLTRRAAWTDENMPIPIVSSVANSRIETTVPPSAPRAGGMTTPSPALPPCPLCPGDGVIVPCRLPSSTPTPSPSVGRCSCSRSRVALASACFSARATREEGGADRSVQFMLYRRWESLLRKVREAGAWCGCESMNTLCAKTLPSCTVQLPSRADTRAGSGFFSGGGANISGLLTPTSTSRTPVWSVTCLASAAALAFGKSKVPGMGSNEGDSGCCRSQRRSAGVLASIAFTCIAKALPSCTDHACSRDIEEGEGGAVAAETSPRSARDH